MSAVEDTTATYHKVSAMKEAIAHLRVRDKRAIFLLMRTAADQLNVDTFFPLQGFTAGEFAVGQVLAENNRKAGASSAAETVMTPIEKTTEPPNKKKSTKSRVDQQQQHSPRNQRLARRPLHSGKK